MAGKVGARITGLWAISFLATTTWMANADSGVEVLEAQSARYSGIPPPPSSVCITFELIVVQEGYAPFRFDNAFCAQLQAHTASSFNAIIAGAGVDLAAPFTPDPSLCSSLSASVCGAFLSAQDAAKVQTELQLQAFFLVKTLGGALCADNPNRYVLLASSNPDDGVAIQEYSDACSVDPSPPCRCNTTRYTTPFYVLPTSTAVPGGVRSGRNVTLHCFTVAAVPPELRVDGPCARSSNVTKLAIWADPARKSVAVWMRITPNGGPRRYIAATWGKWGTSATEWSMRATNLNWTYQQAVGGEVCAELPSNLPLSNFCASGKCFLNLYGDHSCCPTYPSGLPAAVTFPF